MRVDDSSDKCQDIEKGFFFLLPEALFLFNITLNHCTQASLHDAHFLAKCKQQTDAFCMREDCREPKHLEDSTSSVDWDSHWHPGSLRLGVGEGRIRA